MRIVRAIAIVLAWICVVPAAAFAHPLGNFTSNHLTRITVARTTVDVHYVLDDAEIPTFSLLRTLDGNGRPDRATLRSWVTRYAAQIRPQLLLTVDGTTAALRLTKVGAVLRPGAAGLHTLYVTADYRANVSVCAHHLAYRDTTLPGRIGWRDVVVAPAHEPTDELRTYPNALIGSPRDTTAVALAVDAAGRVRTTAVPAELTGDEASGGRMNDLSAILARNLSDPLVLAGALLLALALGALHALEPGHGKTLLAISLVGARATVRQATILAVALTVAHTAGVLLFGAVVLTLARYIVPEALYPWIALVSGVFVAVLGARALSRALAGSPLATAAPSAAAHHHQHGHDHAHAHDHAHPHPHGHVHAADAHDDLAGGDVAHARAHAVPGTAPLRFREALVAAASGNVAPCPAALVVLLAAIATHKIGFGLVLIVAFSIGLALTLTVLGVAVVRSAGWLMKRPQFDRAARYAPLVTAAAISSIGAWMTGQGIAAQGVAIPPALIAAVVVLAIGAYSLVRMTRRSLPRKAIA